MPREIINPDEAQRLVDNPLLNAMLDRIVGEAIEEINLNDLDGYQESNAKRDRLILKVQVVSEIRTKLKNIVQSSRKQK